MNVPVARSDRQIGDLAALAVWIVGGTLVHAVGGTSLASDFSGLIAASAIVAGVGVWRWREDRRSGGLDPEVEWHRSLRRVALVLVLASVACAVTGLALGALVPPAGGSWFENQWFGLGCWIVLGVAVILVPPQPKPVAH